MAYYVIHYAVEMDRYDLSGPFENYGTAAAWAAFGRLNQPRIVKPKSPNLTAEETAALDLLGARYADPSA